MRKISFANDEFYHVYNRGTDKRTIFLDDQDFNRFLQSMIEFNVSDPIGSLYQNSFRKNKLRGSASKSRSKDEKDEQLVEIIVYCLNPNHYHFLLRQVAKKGIEKFMQRLGTGYTMYFNHKYERTGTLFQGRFKAIHVDTNEYLLHVSAYVNLNYRVHQLRGSASQYRASWEEYVASGMKKVRGICHTEPVLGQFQKKSDYIEFAEHSLNGTLERRGLLDEATLLE
jgi:putative transposase